MIRYLFLALLLACTPACAVSIWNSTPVDPVLGTYRIPVDVSSSGSPSHITPETMFTFIESRGNLELYQTSPGDPGKLRVYSGVGVPGSGNIEYLGIVTDEAPGWMMLTANSQGDGADNLGIAISPFGDGALSADVPDSDVTGGIARGVKSVDWQMTRVSAGNAASGNYSVISGGANNTASGAYSWIPGGEGSDTHGVTYAFAYGGDYGQTFGAFIGADTTDGTPTVLSTVAGSIGPAYTVVLPTNSVAACAGVFVVTDATDAAGFECKAVAKNIAGTTTLVTGACVAIGTPDASLATVAMGVQANNTDDTIETTVTGIAATTLKTAGELKCSTTSNPDV